MKRFLPSFLLRFVLVFFPIYGVFYVTAGLVNYGMILTKWESIPSWVTAIAILLSMLWYGLGVVVAELLALHLCPKQKTNAAKHPIFCYLSIGLCGVFLGVVVDILSAYNDISVMFANIAKMLCLTVIWKNLKNNSVEPTFDTERFIWWSSLVTVILAFAVVAAMTPLFKKRHKARLGAYRADVEYAPTYLGTFLLRFLPMYLLFGAVAVLFAWGGGLAAVNLLHLQNQAACNALILPQFILSSAAILLAMYMAYTRLANRNTEPEHPLPLLAATGGILWLMISVVAMRDFVQNGMIQAVGNYADADGKLMLYTVCHGVSVIGCFLEGLLLLIGVSIMGSRFAEQKLWKQ